MALANTSALRVCVYGRRGYGWSETYETDSVSVRVLRCVYVVCVRRACVCVCVCV